MSDEEFDLKKKKKKSKKVDFDAFETEDTPNDGGDAGGVAAAVAEKIEDLDQSVFRVFSRRFWVFLCLLFLHPLFPSLTQRQFSFAKRDGDDDENAMTVVEPLLDLKTAAGDV